MPENAQRKGNWLITSPLPLEHLEPGNGFHSASIQDSGSTPLSGSEDKDEDEATKRGASLMEKALVNGTSKQSSLSTRTRESSTVQAYKISRFDPWAPHHGRSVVEEPVYQATSSMELERSRVARRAGGMNEAG